MKILKTQEEKILFKTMVILSDLALLNFETKPDILSYSYNDLLLVANNHFNHRNWSYYNGITSI